MKRKWPHSILLILFLGWMFYPRQAPSLAPILTAIKIEILDDHGKRTPVMLALREKDSGKNISLGEDPVYTFVFKEKKRAAFTRATPWRGWQPFDCDGLLEKELPPKAYILHIQKGLEYLPIKKTILLKANKTLVLTETLKRFIDLPKAGWWSGDDHVHISRKDTGVDKFLLLSAKANDIHVVNVLQFGDIKNGDMWPQPGFGKEARRVEGQHALVTGQEEPRTHMMGHVIGLNAKTYVRNAEHYLLYDLVFKELHKEQGLVGFAHFTGFGKYDPFNPTPFVHSKAIKKKYLDSDGYEWGNTTYNADLGLILNAPLGLVDFVELMEHSNRLDPRVYFDFLNLGFRLTATAGSDYPFGPVHIGDWRTYVQTGSSTFSADDWFAHIKKGHTYATQGPLIEFKVDGQLSGSEVACKAGQKLKVTVSVDGIPGIGAPQTVVLLKNGKVVESLKSKDPQQTSLKGSWELTANKSYWLAIYARAHNAAPALTTPVYVVVNNKPTIDHSQKKAIVKRFIEKLDLAQAVVSAQNPEKAPAPPPQTQEERRKAYAEIARMKVVLHWRKDKKAFLERVAYARKYYLDLLKD